MGRHRYLLITAAVLFAIVALSPCRTLAEAGPVARSLVGEIK